MIAYFKPSLFCRNHDGSLNPEEVKRGYEKYFDRALSDKEVDAIFKASSSVLRLSGVR